MTRNLLSTERNDTTLGHDDVISDLTLSRQAVIREGCAVILKEVIVNDKKNGTNKRRGMKFMRNNVFIIRGRQLLVGVSPPPRLAALLRHSIASFYKDFLASELSYFVLRTRPSILN